MFTYFIFLLHHNILFYSQIITMQPHAICGTEKFTTNFLIPLPCLCIWFLKYMYMLQFIFLKFCIWNALHNITCMWPVEMIFVSNLSEKKSPESNLLFWFNVPMFLNSKHIMFGHFSQVGNQSLQNVTLFSLNCNFYLFIY